MLYINSDYSFLVSIGNDNMAYKASSANDLRKFLELISDDIEVLSQVKRAIFDPVLDGEENSGMLAFLDDYEIPATIQVSALKGIVFGKH
jgi:hypothetical protein